MQIVSARPLCTSGMLLAQHRDNQTSTSQNKTQVSNAEKFRASRLLFCVERLLSSQPACDDPNKWTSYVVSPNTYMQQSTHKCSSIVVIRII